MASTSDPASYLPLSESVLHILLALAEDPRHGYGIMQEVEDRTGGRVRLGPGTLYGAVKRLREGGLIAEVEDGEIATPEDDRRRYYRLTSLGRTVARCEVQRLVRLVETARGKRLLTEGSS
jgi:DNA-binding PadR family transcriptional regulator